jgi:putative DNA primase/helicase
MTNDNTLTLALAHAARGWYVFPCGSDKKPLTEHGYKDATTDPAMIEAWWKQNPRALIGIACRLSGIFALDVDTKDGRDGWRSLTELQETHGSGSAIPTGPIQRTPSGGAHLIFKHPNFDIPNNSDRLGAGLDLRSHGYICTGAGYTWLPGHGPETPLTDAPGWLLELIRNFKPAQPRPEPRQTYTPAPDAGAYWLSWALRRAHVGTRNETGFTLACQLRDSGLTQAQAENIMLDYAARVPGDGYTAREAEASLRSAYAGPQREAAHLPGIATPADLPMSTNGNGAQPVLSGAKGDLHKTNGPYKLDDIGNGERMAARHGRNIRYVKEWGWLVWNGKYWQPDRGEVARMAKETARSIAGEAAGIDDDDRYKAILKHAAVSASASRRAAMIEACASELGIPAKPAEFDRDPWLLNCQNGILDLRTGELQPHDPGALMTKIAGTDYDPAAQAPIWQAFLERIFNGNQELISFLQRAAGYSLTGNTGEQCLFFAYGIGANGKSTFNGALQAALGDYAVKTPTDTLMLKYGDTNATNDQARLAGARAVFAAELAEGKRLNEPLVKDLTGGDIITARFLHKEFFEFTPVFKLWIYGNHKPIIRGTDEGIWRRIKLIPFMVTIPEGERDLGMPDKLRGELAGILAWAVRGCLAWQREGLRIPAEVTEATADFRAEQDTLATFLAECCVINPLASVTAGELYAEYKNWATESGLDPMSKITLSRRLAERGYSTNGREPGSGRAVYTGLGLLDRANV